MIEILSRLQLPTAPAVGVDVVRKADLGMISNFGTIEPTSPQPGTLWAKPDGTLSVWNGTVWLVL